MEFESKLTDIIASLPEVNGGFLYDPNRGIYSNQTAGIADDISLQHVSVKLTKIVSMLTVHFNDTGGIRVCFKDLILYGLMFEENHWLFLLHQPSLSAGMIKMTVQMALKMDNDEEESQLDAASSNTFKTETTESTTECITQDALVESNPELKIPLATIQDELAEHIGPVAQLVFQETMAFWCNQNTPSLDSLPALLSLLEEEIDEKESRTIFRRKLKSYGGGQE